MMRDNSMVSVVMPCYKAATTLERSIRGVLEQTHGALELWLLIDGRDEPTEELAKQWANKDGRVRLVISDKNRGVSRMRNIGMRLSVGGWIAFCDADDYWYPTKIEKQLALLLQSGANLCCSGFNFYSPSNQVRLPVQTKHHIHLAVLKQTNPIPLSTAVFHHSLRKDSCFPELPSPYIHEDYAFWLRMFQLHAVSVVYQSELTTDITKAEGTRSSNKWLALRSHGYILKTVGGVNGLEWWVLMASYVWHGSLKRVLGKFLPQSS